MALEILAYRCKKCGQLHYPFRMVCKKCGKNEQFEFDTVPLPKKGKLLTFTTVHNLPPDFNVAKLSDERLRRFACEFTVRRPARSCIAGPPPRLLPTANVRRQSHVRPNSVVRH